MKRNVDPEVQSVNKAFIPPVDLGVVRNRDGGAANGG
jgi:hypothetical protein